MIIKKPDVSDRAKDDLKEVWFYIAQDSLEHADRLIQDLYDSMNRLAAMPGMGHRRKDLTKDETLSFWSVGRYIIVYRPDHTPIEIVRVFHSARDIATLLEDS